MVTVKAAQDEVEHQNPRIFSSANKIPKGKTLDSDPYLHAMSI